MKASHYIDERLEVTIDMPHITLWRIALAALSDELTPSEWILRALEPALSRARKMNLPTVETK